GHDADDEDQADNHGDRFAQHLEPFDAGPIGEAATEFADLVLEHHNDQGAEHGPDEGAQATDQRHEDDQAGHLPGGIGQGGRHEHQGLRGTCQARQRGGDHEYQQFEVADVISQRDGPGFVFTQGLQDLAKGGIDGAPAYEEAKHEHHQHEVIQV